MFGAVLGPRFAPTGLPLATAFFARTAATADAAVDPAKKEFARLRPFLASADVKALGPASKSGAWPSGHATQVTVQAIILAAMLPARREAIWARAADYAESRVVIGMHHPQDLAMGSRAGTAIAALLFADPGFRADYEAVRAELRRALGE
jgi:acid phosphatase (class A)